MRNLFFLAIVSGALFAAPHATIAANLILMSDATTDSRPSIESNHTITFTLPHTVPSGGHVVITFEDAFVIPGALDVSDIDLLVLGVNVPLAVFPGVGAGSPHGVTVGGHIIIITLNDTDVFAMGKILQIKIGSHAVFGSIGDQQIKNPAVLGKHAVVAETHDALDAVIDRGETLIFMVPGIIATTGTLVPPIVGVSPSSASLPRVFYDSEDIVQSLPERRVLRAVETLVELDPLPKGTKLIKRYKLNAIFSYDLARGMRGSDVSRLQELLARDKDVYPEGLVTGIFGLKTANAVERFQLKYKIISRVGEQGSSRVGPRTRAKLKELFNGQEVVAVGVEKLSQTVESKVDAVLRVVRSLLTITRELLVDLANFLGYSEVR